jgi:Flp pilus assembly pilin Flp
MKNDQWPRRGRVFFPTGRRGGAFAEYALLLGLLAVLSIGAVTGTGERIVEIFEDNTVALNTKGPNDNASDTGKENAAKNKPKLIGIEVPPDGEYSAGDVLTFTLLFDKAVKVPGPAYIEIDVGGTIRQVMFDGGPKGPSASFSYTITEDDTDTDGIDISPDVGGGEVTDDDGLPLEDGDGDGPDPNTGDIVIPGPATCAADCLHVAMADGNIVKVGDDGRTVWTFTGHSGIVQKIAVDGAGFIYTAGADGTTRKISPEGEQVWSSIVFGDGLLDVAVASNGDVYSAGWLGHINKLDGNTGQVTGFVEIQNGRDITGLAVDGAGMVYASTKSHGGTDGRYVKLDSNLNVLWSRTNASKDLNDIGIDTAGRIYTVGHRYQYNYDDDNQVDDSGYVYQPNGTTLARLYYPADGQSIAIAPNPAGGAALSMRHFNPTRYDVLSFGLSNNNVQWTYSGRQGSVNDLTYDRSGNLYTGSSDGDVTILDAATGSVLETYSFSSAVHGVAVSPGEAGAGF